VLSQFADVINVVVIEDDPGDALIAEEYLAEEPSGKFQVLWTRTLAEGVAAIDSSTDCVLLDLGLPDSQGVSALEAVRAAAPRVPIVVLTGYDDRAAGTLAVNAGAQDYLVKGDVTPPTLARSIAYAMARAGVEDRDLKLLEADLSQRENRRLALGLTPQLHVSDPTLRCATLYRPAGGSNLLGGDFLDAIERPDGTVRLVLGDVAGHGPEEAALGVSLRVGWRSLVLGGSQPGATLGHLEELLRVESTDPFTFATVCEATISPDRRTLSVCLAGHPPLVLIDGSGAHLLELPAHTPLGVDGPARCATDIELDGAWTLLAYSDGIFEGRDGDSGERLGLDAFVEAVQAAVRPGEATHAGLEELLTVAETRHGGPLEDDVALLACSRTA
jgi:DNA-binding NarL/FixJ family response regulator